MVCKQCRDAASFLGEEEVIYQYLDGREQELMAGREVAVLWHAQCREVARQRDKTLSTVARGGGSLCDCQHVIPSRPAREAPTLSR